jgi:hypothetical protein
MAPEAYLELQCLACKSRKPLEGFHEIPGWEIPVDDPKGHSLTRHLIQHFENGPEGPPPFHVHVLEIGCGYPHVSLSPQDTLEYDLPVELFSEKEFQLRHLNRLRFPHIAGQPCSKEWKPPSLPSVSVGKGNGVLGQVPSHFHGAVSLRGRLLDLPYLSLVLVSRAQMHQDHPGCPCPGSYPRCIG